VCVLTIVKDFKEQYIEGIKRIAIQIVEFYYVFKMKKFNLITDSLISSFKLTI